MGPELVAHTLDPYHPDTAEISASVRLGQVPRATWVASSWQCRGSGPQGAVRWRGSSIPLGLLASFPMSRTSQ